MKEGLEKIKGNYLKNTNKKILKNYYSKEIRKGRSYRAVTMDKVLIFIILLGLLTAFLAIKSNNFLLSLYMSLIITFFILNIGILVSKNRKEKKIQIINDELKSKKVVREVTHLNKGGFVNYIKLMLDEYYNIEFEYSNMPLDLIGTINNEQYGVKCIKLTSDEKVTLRDLDMFMREMENSDLDEGILITNSYFRDDVKEEAKIILFDLDSIKDILKQINKYPTEEEINTYIIDRHVDRRNALKKEITTINKKKIFQLYGIFIIFYLISFIVKYSIYYKIMSVFAFVIATGLAGYKISEYVSINRKYPFT